MWASIPLTEQEMNWIERLTEPWRVSKDSLYRKSNVELALVVSGVWEKWGLPNPPGPILTLQVESEDRVEEIVQEGAVWEQPVGTTKWGARVGFLRFPSGLLIEITFPKTEGAE